MIFTQYYLDCLSQASYLVGDETTGQAVVVDPRRDIEDYLADAAARNLRIVGVINTHFHADFVSGHLELAEATGAWIGYGDVAAPDFDWRPLADHERISLGDVALEILHTPGHTPESISVLVYEHATDEVAYGVLTGDALFIGDVGRPDLLASVGVTAEELGSQLYHSIHTTLMGLPDAVRVFPAHGAGSACGKNLSTERQSTIGEQRALNYACRPMSEEDFVAVVTEGQPSTPAYFLFNATLNKQDRELRELGSRAEALDDEQIEAAVAGGAIIHDARDAMSFASGHLRGSISVPFDGRMAETAGMVLTPDQDIVILAPDGEEQAVATRLARIGYDRVLGYIPRPEAYLLSHQDQVQQASRLTVTQLEDILAEAASAPADQAVQVVDIRNIGELVNGVIPGTIHMPLGELARRAGELDPARPVVLHCAGGWRSSVGASLLRRRGFADVSDLLGGFGAWAAAHQLAVV
jgi:hydroxyacylglutathione hydrolase